MDVAALGDVKAFITADGSTIRELHNTGSQSLAEATLSAGQATRRHHHARTEEIYFVLEGSGELEVNGDRRSVEPGEAILIPAGAWHEITAAAHLRFLCCCAPAYSHEDTFFE